MNACLIGVSGFAQRHYADLLRESDAGRVKLLAATVINPEEEVEKCARLRELGCKLYERYEDMLAAEAGRCQICFIPTGIALHRVMTEAALAVGMHVFVEKPAAAVIEDVVAMGKAAEAADRFVAVGFQDMYNPSTQALKRLILAGEIGSLRSVRCLGVAPRDRNYYRRNGWAGRLRANGHWVLDGPHNNAMAHEVMMMLYLAGEREAEAAPVRRVEAELYEFVGIETANTVCFRAETPAGVALLGYMSHAWGKQIESRIEVTGSEGRITWSRQGARVEGRSGVRSIEEKPVDRSVIFDCLLALNRGEKVFYPDVAFAGRQTRLANATFAAAPVVHINRDDLQSVDTQGGEMTTIPGIADDLTVAFDACALPGELGFAWARPAGVFNVPAQYSSFGGLAGTEEPTDTHSLRRVD